jgi:hypothetical protein
MEQLVLTDADKRAALAMRRAEAAARLFGHDSTMIPCGFCGWSSLPELERVADDDPRHPIPRCEVCASCR